MTTQPAADPLTNAVRVTRDAVQFGRERALRRPRLTHTVAALALFVLTFSQGLGNPATGLDPSWMAGLSEAWHEQFAFGRDIVFTFGPLGFLSNPDIYDSGVYPLVFATTVVLHAAAVPLAWAAASKTWGRGWGWFIAAVPLAVSEPRIVVLVAGSMLVIGIVDRRLPWWVPVAFGSWAGFELLGKQSTGVEIALALAAVFAFGPRPRLKSFGLFLLSSACSVVALWLIAGQEIGALPDFARASLEVILGYSAAMSSSDASLEWTYWAAAILALITGLGIWTVLRTSPRQVHPWALIAVSGLVLFLGFKATFVRQDSGHSFFYFSACVALITLFPWGETRRAWALAAGGLALILYFALLVPTSAVDVFLTVGIALVILGPLLATRRVGLTLAALAVVVTYLVVQGGPYPAIDPVAHAKSLRSAAELAASDSEQARRLAKGRADMVMTYGLEPGTLSVLRGRTVAVLPYETGVVQAYGLRWRPLPAFQDYLAYTGHLDRLNADALAGRHGPERILQQAQSYTDGRLPGWDPPSANVALLCHFRPVALQAEWRVLARTANVCGKTRKLKTVRARWGESVSVPDVGDDQILTVRVSGLEPHGPEVVRALAWKPAERFAAFGKRVVRVITATADNGLLLEAPSAIDSPGAFRLAPSLKSLTFLKGDKKVSEQSGGDLRMRFETRTVVAPYLDEKSAFLTGAARVCKALNAGIRTMQTDFAVAAPQADNLRDLAPILKRSVTLSRAAYAEIARLRAPDGDEGLVDQMLGLLERRQKLFAQAVRAAEASDAVGYRQGIELVAAINKPLVYAASGYGVAPACGER